MKVNSTVVLVQSFLKFFLNKNFRPKKVGESASATKKRRSRVSLDSVACLRKKEDIIKSGCYNRDTFVPPKGKGKYWQKTWQVKRGTTDLAMSWHIL